MTQQVAGFPYWEVAFNENGQSIQPEQAETLLADVLAQDITDLFERVTVGTQVMVLC